MAEEMETNASLNSASKEDEHTATSGKECRSRIEARGGMAFVVENPFRRTNLDGETLPSYALPTVASRIRMSMSTDKLSTDELPVCHRYRAPSPLCHSMKDQRSRSVDNGLRKCQAEIQKVSERLNTPRRKESSSSRGKSNSSTPASIQTPPQLSSPLKSSGKPSSLSSSFTEENGKSARNRETCSHRHGNYATSPGRLNKESSKEEIATTLSKESNKQGNLMTSSKESSKQGGITASSKDLAKQGNVTTSKETSRQSSVTTPSKESVKLSSVTTPKESSKQGSVTTPSKESVKLGSVTTPKESSKQGSATTPKESSKQGSVTTPKESSKQGNVTTPSKESVKLGIVTTPKESSRQSKESSKQGNVITSPKEASKEGNGVSSPREGNKDGISITSPKESNKQGNITSKEATRQGSVTTPSKESAKDLDVKPAQRKHISTSRSPVPMTTKEAKPPRPERDGKMTKSKEKAPAAESEAFSPDMPSGKATPNKNENGKESSSETVIDTSGQKVASEGAKDEQNKAKADPAVDEYRARLAEKRRLAREKAEREVEEEKQRKEEMRIAEEERRRREEEEQKRREEEELRQAEELRKSEEERFQRMVEMEEKRRREEAEQVEADLQAKLEQQRRAKEESEKQDLERVARIKREEEEKMDRKRRLESIMKRVKTEDAPSPAKTESSLPQEAETNTNGTVAATETCPPKADSAPSLLTMLNSSVEGTGSEADKAVSDSGMPKFKSPLLQQILAGKSKTKVQSSEPQTEAATDQPSGDVRGNPDGTSNPDEVPSEEGRLNTTCA